MANSKLTLPLIVVLFLLVLGLSTFWFAEQYLLFSMALIGISMIPFFLKFENRETEAREIVLIALLASIAAVSRVPFASLPSVQPTSFVIIMTGLVFGKETGFMAGAAAALISNIFLGQGPWTPWQMLCWGLMGLTAGYFREKKLLHSQGQLLFFGFGWGFIFGWIMNLWFIIGFLGPLTWGTVVKAYIASFYFDLAHALSNVFFLKIFAGKWQKILGRIQRKYGLIDNKEPERHSFIKIEGF